MTKWRVYQEKENVFLIQRKVWFFWRSEYEECFYGREKVYFSNLQSAMEAIDSELTGEVKVVGKVVAQNNGDEWNKMADMISVVPVKPTPDISEPVTSFIKCFKDNPKRFKVKQVVLSKDYYEFSDTEKNKNWVFYYLPESRGRYGCYITGADWITEDEKEAIVSALSPYFTTERRERLHAIQRQRLTRIYKEKV